MNTKMKRIALGLIMVAATGLLAGCGGERLGYVDGTQLQQTQKYKDTVKKIQDKDAEIKARLTEAHQSQSEEEFAKTMQNAEQEKNVFDNAVARDFTSYMESQVAAVAKEKKLDIIVDKRAVTSGGEDITADLLKRINADTSQAAGTAAPAQSSSGTAASGSSEQK